MRILDPATTLESVQFLRSLKPADAKKLMQLARVRHAHPRDRLWSTGDPVAGPVLIVSGLARLFLEHDQGGETPFACLWTGDIPAPSLQAQKDWRVSAAAVTPVIHAIFPIEPFLEACVRTPQLGQQVLNDLATVYYNRSYWEAMLRIIPLKQRLLKLLARMADEVGTPNEEGILLDFPLTHQTVADLSWVQRDQAGRVLNELADEGYIVARPRFRWLIPDRRRLGPQPMIAPLVP